MIGEIDIYGVFFPPLLIWIGAALIVAVFIRRAMTTLGIYRFIWHRPLFDFCLLVVLTGLINLLSNRYF